MIVCFVLIIFCFQDYFTETVNGEMVHPRWDYTEDRRIVPPGHPVLAEGIEKYLLPGVAMMVMMTSFHI